MSQEVLEERVGRLETGFSDLRAEVRVIGHDQASMRGDVSTIGHDIKKLLERDAGRPKPLSWAAIGGTVAATAAGLISVALVGWWMIGSSPAVQELKDSVAGVRQDVERQVQATQRRLDKLDDPDVGRVPRVERKVQELEAWRPSVTRF